MSKDGSTPETFGDYLAGAIRDAGFTKPTFFARKAGIDPSVVFRWLSGEQRPTLASLRRIAPILHVDVNALANVAYPPADETPTPNGENRPAEERKPLSPEIRRWLAIMADPDVPNATKQRMKTQMRLWVEQIEQNEAEQANRSSRPRRSE